MRKIIVVMLLTSLLSELSVYAGTFELPKDLPTSEALIALHKQVKKDEDEALKNITVSMGEQTLVSKASKKFNDVRTTLDSKLNNVYSYVMLGAALSSTSIALAKVSSDYVKFSKNTAAKVVEKPFVAWYYAEANHAIVREVKHCQQLYASMAAEGLNVMKASMSEKLNLVMTLRTSVDRIQAIIDNANLYCYLITDGGWKPDYIWEILTSDLKDEIVKGLVYAWQSEGNHEN